MTYCDRDDILDEDQMTGPHDSLRTGIYGGYEDD